MDLKHGEISGKGKILTFLDLYRVLKTGKGKYRKILTFLDLQCVLKTGKGKSRKILTFLGLYCVLKTGIFITNTYQRLNFYECFYSFFHSIF